MFCAPESIDRQVRDIKKKSFVISLRKLTNKSVFLQSCSALVLCRDADIKDMTAIPAKLILK